MCHAPTVRLFMLLVLLVPTVSTSAQELATGVRGLATRVPAAVILDGDLAEFKNAFCTPINYFHPDAKNRAAQFFYMWDDEAFYAAGVLKLRDRGAANEIGVEVTIR